LRREQAQHKLTIKHKLHMSAKDEKIKKDSEKTAADPKAANKWISKVVDVYCLCLCAGVSVLSRYLCVSACVCLCVRLTPSLQSRRRRAQKPRRRP